MGHVTGGRSTDLNNDDNPEHYTKRRQIPPIDDVLRVPFSSFKKKIT